MKISTATRLLLTQCKVHGSGDAQVVISNSEVYALIFISVRDLGWEIEDLNLEPISLPSANYFTIPVEWFANLAVKGETSQHLLVALAKATEREADYALYIQNLSALHRRRVKYQRILSQQPRPQMTQIGPRTLIEFGICDSRLLSSWLIWRKWIYDIDNRAAQETGYLFEPILASSLGGEPIGANNSPVKRLDAEGNPTNRGRQIDCFIAAENLAYEFKLRVTIAASGQGRFGEELSFPYECEAADITPILLVLDPTPSPRLIQLEEAFINAGGRSFVGDAAWEHMEEEAGDVMSVFIEKYIRPPIEAMSEFEEGEALSEIHLRWAKDSITIENGEGHLYRINRSM